MSIFKATAAFLALASCGCGSTGPRSESMPPAQPIAQHAAAAAATPRTDGPRSATSTALLEMGFAVGASIPATPHQYERSRAQSDAALACLELGLVDLALQYADRLGDWRRGEIVARVGQRYAAAGDTERALRCAALARASMEGALDWQQERLSTDIALIHARLGDTAAVQAAAPALSQASQGELQAARVATATADQLDDLAAMFDRAIATQNFDLARSGVEGHIAVIRRSADDHSHRERSMAALERALPGLPAGLQVEYRVLIANALRDAQQRTSALEQLDLAARALAVAALPAEEIAPMGAALEQARIRAGQQSEAVRALRQLRATYEARRNEIVDLRRAASLRALAEAFMAAGEPALAADCYSSALAEGARNPNARPRALDLSATCVSMARSGFEPPADMLRRMDAIRAALTDPW